MGARGVEQRRPYFLARDVDLRIHEAGVGRDGAGRVEGRTEDRGWCVGFMRCPRTSPH